MQETEQDSSFGKTHGNQNERQIFAVAKDRKQKVRAPNLKRPQANTNQVFGIR